MKMKKIKLLFICGMNQWRSPTAECIYQNDPRCDVRSAGVRPQARRRVSQKDLEWADIIFCMEEKHKDRLGSQFPLSSYSRIVVLGVSDEYKYMDPELVELLKNHVDPYLASST